MSIHDLIDGQVERSNKGAVKATQSAETVLGASLKVGDTIETFWGAGRDTIIALEPYKGPLAGLWDGKARIATFAILKTGMTIDPNERFQRIGRGQA